MSELHSRITATALGHSYMGEVIPASYLKAESLIMKMRGEYQERSLLPIVNLTTEFLPRLSAEYNIREEEGKRTLKLLHAWGKCVHFESLPSSSLLAEYFVLDPTLLTQQVLAAVFGPDCASFNFFNSISSFFFFELY